MKHETRFSPLSTLSSVKGFNNLSQSRTVSVCFVCSCALIACDCEINFESSDPEVQLRCQVRYRVTACQFPEIATNLFLTLY
jgi:hypothetical protein